VGSEQGVSQEKVDSGQGLGGNALRTIIIITVIIISAAITIITITIAEGFISGAIWPQGTK
jgi:hypothetical protein